MVIRIAKESDIPQMLEIYSHYVQNTTYSFEYTTPTTEEFACRICRITQQFSWLVCEEKGCVLGYAYGSAPFERQAYQWCSELSVYVRPSAQGKGIGRKLYEASEQILEKQGYRKVYAIITSENEGSLAFHRTLGYETVAEFPDCGIKFGRSLGTIWMEKQLKSVEIPTKQPVPWYCVVNFDRNKEKVLAKMSLS